MFPPTEWEGTDEYTTSTFIGVLSWNQTTMRLTSTLAAFTTIVAGDYVYLYDSADENYQHVGIVSEVISTTVLEIDTWIDSNANMASDVPATNAAVSGEEGGFQVQSIAEHALFPRKVVTYKIRFKNSLSGTVSNTLTAEKRIVCPKIVTRINIIGLPTTATDSDVDYIEVFRYDASVATAQVYRKVAEVALGTTALADKHNFDGTEDIWLEDKNYPAVDEDGNRIAFTNLMLYANRLWGIWQNRVSLMVGSLRVLSTSDKQG